MKQFMKPNSKYFFFVSSKSESFFCSWMRKKRIFTNNIPKTKKKKIRPFSNLRLSHIIGPKKILPFFLLIELYVESLKIVSRIFSYIKSELWIIFFSNDCSLSFFFVWSCKFKFFAFQFIAFRCIIFPLNCFFFVELEFHLNFVI